MIRTRVGYSGGTSASPTYRSIGNHSETVEVDFDPSVIGYERLLDIFWSGHDPLAKSWSRQYRAAIFYHGGAQKAAAEASRDRLAARLGRRVATEILPAGTFHRAEGYHQKYLLQGKPELADEIRARNPGEERFTDSTAAARINGYLGGHGSLAQLRREIEGFGLSSKAARLLWELVAKREAERGGAEGADMACPVR